MHKYWTHPLFLLLLITSTGCAHQLNLHTRVKKDGKIHNFIIHSSLAQKRDSQPALEDLFASFDTVYYFYIQKNIPAPLISPVASLEQKVPTTLRFALAKKGLDAYFWGDQNFNGTFKDDPLEVRHNFFSDTAYRWLRQRDKKIDYSFTVQHLSEKKNNIPLDLSIDFYKVPVRGKAGFSTEISFSSKPRYQKATFWSGLKRYVAVVDYLPVAKSWGIEDEKVYFFPKSQVRRQKRVEHAKGFVKGDTVRLGKKDWVLDDLSYRGDRMVLTKVQSRSKIKGWIEGTYIDSFGDMEIFSDSLVTSQNLLQKKYTLLVFWAFWCAPCRYQIPAYSSLYASLDKETTNMLGVIVDKATFKDSIKKDIQDHNVAWPNVLSELVSEKLTGIAAKLRVESIPTYIIFDSQGKILYRGSEIEGVNEILLQLRSKQ